MEWNRGWGCEPFMKGMARASGERGIAIDMGMYFVFSKQPLLANLFCLLPERLHFVQTQF
jgi:hypothetical protein